MAEDNRESPRQQGILIIQNRNVLARAKGFAG